MNFMQRTGKKKAITFSYDDGVTQDINLIEMMNQYGLDTGCLVLSPQSREKLTKIVTHTDTPYKRQLLEQFWHKITGRIR